MSEPDDIVKELQFLAPLVDHPAFWLRTRKACGHAADKIERLEKRVATLTGERKKLADKVKGLKAEVKELRDSSNPAMWEKP